MESSDEHSRKRRRLSNEEDKDQVDRRKLIHESLTKPVSPPPLRRARLTVPETPKVTRSPFQLTSIRDLPAASNVDAVSLKDILGDPLISECWEFNYLHNLDFLMEAFDDDVREMVKVHVVHGFWKQEDQSRLNLKVCEVVIQNNVERVILIVLARNKPKSIPILHFIQLTCQKCSVPTTPRYGCDT